MAKYGIWFKAPAYDIVDDDYGPCWILLDDTNRPQLFNSFEDAEQRIRSMNNPLKWEHYEPRIFVEDSALC